jgi:hypothetical protein
VAVVPWPSPGYWMTITEYEGTGRNRRVRRRVCVYRRSTFAERDYLCFISNIDIDTDGMLNDSALVAVVNSLSGPTSAMSGSLLPKVIPQDEVYLPSDGIHLEAVAGTCILPGLS